MPSGLNDPRPFPLIFLSLSLCHRDCGDKPRCARTCATLFIQRSRKKRYMSVHARSTFLPHFLPDIGADWRRRPARPRPGGTIDGPADRIEQPAEPAAGAGSTGGMRPAAATTPAVAQPKPAENSMCLMIESAARANDLPVEFFARVIWQESRFSGGAIGPLTRSGARAQGIAQFNAGDGRRARLLDPFDPVQALPKSAEYLKELRQDFGNLGLAAAAYNAGPRRLRDWLAGSGFMPRETRSYVAAITGRTVEDWSAARAKPEAAMPPRAAPAAAS